ncbi:MAG TPA: hypothetical protein VGD56_21340 [Gemmatirosa sp.]
MDESQRPHVHRKPWGALLLELAITGAGVFMALQVDQWKEHRAHREAARTTVANFRREVAANRASVATVLPYHAALRETVGAVAARETPSLDAVFRVFRFQGQGFRGFRPPHLSRTAYDLAFATQSLAYLPPDLAFAVAGAYQQQSTYEGIQRAFDGSVYSPTFFRADNASASVTAMSIYLGDVAYQEPELLRQYAALLPKLDSALAALPK